MLLKWKLLSVPLMIVTVAQAGYIQFKLNGRDLPDMDPGYAVKPDSYFIAYIRRAGRPFHKRAYKSKYIPEEYNPDWKEIYVTYENPDDSFWFAIWDHDVLDMDDMMGVFMGDASWFLRKGRIMSLYPHEGHVGVRAWTTLNPTGDEMRSPTE